MILDWSDIPSINVNVLAYRRLLEIAAAGFHNLLLVGNDGLYPCSHVEMLARRLPSILPPLTEEEQFITGVYDKTQRPIASPHYTAQRLNVESGDAFGGALLLEDLPEYRRECHQDILERPGWYFIVATAPHPERVGVLLQAGLAPLFDMQWGNLIHGLPAMPIQDDPEPSAAVLRRVARAWDAQDMRYGRGKRWRNGKSADDVFARYALPTVDTDALERAAEIAADRFGLKHVDAELAPVCRVARTIADLRGSQAVQLQDLAEALDLRVLAEPPVKSSKQRRAK